MAPAPLPKEEPVAPKEGKARGWHGARASAGGVAQNGVSGDRSLVMKGRYSFENWKIS